MWRDPKLFLRTDRFLFWSKFFGLEGGATLQVTKTLLEETLGVGPVGSSPCVTQVTVMDVFPASGVYSRSLQ